MPTTITTTVYTFSELSEDAQQKAIEDSRYANVADLEWWDTTYEDARTIGLEITGFDLGNRKTIAGKLLKTLPECCRLVRANHGKSCDTFRTALHYNHRYFLEFSRWRRAMLSDPDVCENWRPSDWLAEFSDTPEATDTANDFRLDLLSDYRSILDSEYDYLTGDVAISESLTANEYRFTADGSRF
jgi:hypothetical protein